MDVVVRRKSHKSAWLIACLWLLVIISSVAVIFSAHKSREKFNQLEQLKREQYAQEVEWSQLLLEQSTWSSYNRIENQAKQRLQMKSPDVEELVLIEP